MALAFMSCMWAGEVRRSGKNIVCGRKTPGNTPLKPLSIRPPILKIVAEGIPRQCQDYPTATLDGEQFRITLWDGSGEYRAQIWEPYTRTDDVCPWIEVIDATRGAGGLVSREFVAVLWQ